MFDAAAHLRSCRRSVRLTPARRMLALWSILHASNLIARWNDSIGALLETSVPSKG